MKYEVDTYKLEYNENTNKYYISFRDSVNEECVLEIDKNIYDVYIESKKSYTKIKNQDSRYNEQYEQYEQTEISLYARVFYKQTGIENTIIDNFEFERLRKAKSTLTEIQRKRIELHIEDGLTLNEIAKIEGVRKNKIDKSITQGMKKLKKILKMGGQNG